MRNLHMSYEDIISMTPRQLKIMGNNIYRILSIENGSDSKDSNIKTKVEDPVNKAKLDMLNKQLEANKKKGIKKLKIEDLFAITK